MDGAEPFVRTGRQVPAIVLFETSTVGFDDGIVYQTYRWFGHKGHPVPIALRVIPCGVEVMPCRGCKTANHVYLPQVGRHGMYLIMAIYLLHRIDGLLPVVVPDAALHQLFGHGIVGT